MGMRARISSTLLRRIIDEATASPGAEVCGLLFGSPHRIDAAQPCRNVALAPADSFEIDPAALLAAHKATRAGGPAIAGCYHSHPCGPAEPSRSEEHTSELQSLMRISYAVFCLKKKNKN